MNPSNGGSPSWTGTMDSTVRHYTPSGKKALLTIRMHTNDNDVAGSVFIQDAYRLKGIEFEGYALDVGAHIGSVSVLLALDNPKLKVVAIEPVPENLALLRENIAQNKLEDQIIVLPCAAGKYGAKTMPIRYGYRHYENPGDATIVPDTYTLHHRWVAETFGARGDPEFTIQVPVISLPELIGEYGDISLMKIDCEGAEWEFLDADCSRVDKIVGEFHALLPDDINYTPYVRDQLELMLFKTHSVTFWSDETVVGAFDAVRRW